MENEERERESLSQMRVASHKLDNLVFPILRRPQGGEGGPASRDEVDWSCRWYSYSLLSHFREMLRSFFLLFDQNHMPARLVICRCLFELAAHAHYVHKHVMQHLRSNDVQAAWDFLEKVNLGSFHMHEQSVAARSKELFPAPPHIKAVVQCFNEIDRASGATTAYDFFSELSHPGWASFKQYYSMTADPKGFVRTHFTAPRTFPLVAYVPYVSFALETTAHLVSDVLEQAGDATMAERLRVILRRTA